MVELVNRIHTAFSTRVQIMKQDMEIDMRAAIQNHPAFLVDVQQDTIGLRFRTDVLDFSIFNGFDDPLLPLLLERKASPIHGIGVFSKIPFPVVGTVIRSSYKGLLKYIWETDDWTMEQDAYNMTMPCLPFLVYTGDPRQLHMPAPYALYINEANTKSDANVKFHVHEPASFVIYIETLQPIRAGQELLMDRFVSTLRGPFAPQLTVCIQLWTALFSWRNEIAMHQAIEISNARIVNR